MGILRGAHKHFAATLIIGVRTGVLVHDLRTVGTQRNPQHDGGQYDLPEPQQSDHDPQGHRIRCYYRGESLGACWLLKLAEAISKAAASSLPNSWKCPPIRNTHGSAINVQLSVVKSSLSLLIGRDREANLGYPGKSIRGPSDLDRGAGAPFHGL